MQSNNFFPVCEKQADADIDNEFIEIWFDNDFQNSETTLLFMKTFVELMEKGWAPNSISWCRFIDKAKVFFCKNSANEVLSGIVFVYNDAAREAWVLLSFTAPSMRKKGLNKLLFKHFEKYMKGKGAKSIAVHVHKDNKPRLIASQRNGMEIKFVQLIKEI